ncbi:fimbrial protein [Edwardsiella hoshinae]|uniref:Fimbrial protein n=1 Tax=Edwardsiella hoshinae TaxID=93378 RepID=A0A376DJY8_9GAMM|nr:fimbrial protein [Edwardsiella hoshinae]AOV97540.1 fimbrial protein [Edwardsiella hoshinae]QPR29562.1 fimbrial protein [Edwardsiella hoshinae]STC90075.1 P pilus assembly protein, pilin FimA [Edwardsiella hoshinae]
MTKSITLKTLLMLGLLALLGFSVSRQAFALSCREGSNAHRPYPSGLLSQTIEIEQPIVLSASEFVRDRLIWRSPTFTSTFTCWDTNNHPQGEDAYIYWNPQGWLRWLDPSLAVGVSINGVDYDGINRQEGSKGPNLGPATLPRYHHWYQARPQTVRVSYSVYIKATGVPPPAVFRPFGIAPALFQVDGVGGLNATPDSNFRAHIRGLDRIQVIHCNPQIHVQTNGGNSIHFGKLSAARARPGEIAAQQSFTITARLRGGQCGGQQLQASFSTLRPDASDRTLILPDSAPGVGIFLSKASSPTQPIPLQTNVDFGEKLHDKQYEVSENFIANLKWLTDRPKAGKFHATANVDVTFK